MLWLRVVAYFYVPVLSSLSSSDLHLATEILFCQHTPLTPEQPLKSSKFLDNQLCQDPKEFSRS